MLIDVALSLAGAAGVLAGAALLLVCVLAGIPERQS